MSWKGLCAMALLAACGQPSEGEGPKDGPGDTEVPTPTGTPTGSTTTDTRVPGEFYFDLVPSEFVANVWIATWGGPIGEGILEVALDGETPVAWGPRNCSGTDHELPLLGLKAGRTYQVRAVVEDETGARTESELQTITVPELPYEYPVLTRVTADPKLSELVRGYVLFVQYDTQGVWVSILDGDGDVVWFQKNTKPAYQMGRTHLSRDQRSVLYSEYLVTVDDGGWIRRVGLDGRDRTDTRALEHHHDFWELPDGKFAWLGWEYADVDLEGALTPVVFDTIFEIAEGSGEDVVPTLVFSMLDGYPRPPEYTCSHVTYGVWTPGYVEYSHSNSLLYLEDEDAYLMYARWQDATLKIDRSTGSLIWVLGGLENEFTEITPGELPDHGHFSQLDGDDLLVFDNVLHGTRKTRAAEYHIDEAARTVELVWSVDDPYNRSSNYLGDARRLPGGNTAVTWTPFGSLTEHTPDGTLVYEADNAANVSRFEYLTDLYAGYVDAAGMSCEQPAP